jgi:O-antigen ligase
MQNFLNRLDEIAQVNSENKGAARLERIAFVFLALMVLSAPHSIAATQTAWILGMLAWTIRLFVKPRPNLTRTPLDFALWAFFGWSVVSSIFSYAPDISLDKLRGVALFLIFYFVVNVVRTPRAARFLAVALVASCMVNVLYTPIERLVGRGVEINGVRAESPLKKALLFDGDTLLKANDRKIKTPEDLVAEIERSETTKIEFYRPDFYFAVDVKRADLLDGASAAQRLGIESWKPSRKWRATGFYGHWTTYGEVLQLVASLVFGLLIALLSKENFSTRKRGDAEKEDEKTRDDENQHFADQDKISASPRLRAAASLFPFLPFSLFPLLLLLSLAGMLFALLLNATRASQAGFLLSAFAIVLLNRNRKLIFAAAAIALPLVVVGAIYLQQSRNVGFVDAQDESTKYRQTMHRDGLRLWTESPRHFVFGVGMDSIKRHWQTWDLFDKGNLPLGHFHSTPLQLAVERGLPALLLWFWILWIYARTLWRAISNYKLRITDSKIEKSEIRNPKSKIERGTLLGCFGGMLGFAASGFVHYNLGDQEVAMIFFLLMGLSFVLVKLKPSFQAGNARV